MINNNSNKEKSSKEMHSHLGHVPNEQHDQLGACCYKSFGAGGLDEFYCINVTRSDCEGYAPIWEAYYLGDFPCNAPEWNATGPACNPTFNPRPGSGQPQVTHGWTWENKSCGDDDSCAPECPSEDDCCGIGLFICNQNAIADANYEVRINDILVGTYAGGGDSLNRAEYIATDDDLGLPTCDLSQYHLCGGTYECATCGGEPVLVVGGGEAIQSYTFPWSVLRAGSNSVLITTEEADSEQDNPIFTFRVCGKLCGVPIGGEVDCGTEGECDPCESGKSTDCCDCVTGQVIKPDDVDVVRSGGIQESRVSYQVGTKGEIDLYMGGCMRLPDNFRVYYDGAKIFESNVCFRCDAAGATPGAILPDGGPGAGADYPWPGPCIGNSTGVRSPGTAGPTRIAWGPGNSTEITIVVNEGGNTSEGTCWDYYFDAVSGLASGGVTFNLRELDLCCCGIEPPEEPGPGACVLCVADAGVLTTRGEEDECHATENCDPNVFGTVANPLASCNPGKLGADCETFPCRNYAGVTRGDWGCYGCFGYSYPEYQGSFDNTEYNDWLVGLCQTRWPGTTAVKDGSPAGANDCCNNSGWVVDDSGYPPFESGYSNCGDVYPDEACSDDFVINTWVVVINNGFGGAGTGWVDQSAVDAGIADMNARMAFIGGGGEAGDVGIQFELKGTTFISDNSGKLWSQLEEPPLATINWAKGQGADPMTNYVIWILPMENSSGFSSGTLGSWSTFPAGYGTNAFDATYMSAGNWVNSPAPIFSDLNQGALLVHETGHYLGLGHTWGDGNCYADDGFTDTPLHNGPTNGCPCASHHSVFSNTANCAHDPRNLGWYEWTLANDPTGEYPDPNPGQGINAFGMCHPAGNLGFSLGSPPPPIHNYMNYTNDDCMKSEAGIGFSEEQIAMMVSVLELVRTDICPTCGSGVLTQGVN